MFLYSWRKHGGKVVEGLSGPPSAGPWSKWFGGIAVPLGLIVYGVICIVNGRGYLPGRNYTLLIRDANAVALGIACIAGGAFLHCHYFWSNITVLIKWVDLGKVITATVFVISFGYLIFRIAVGI